MKPAGQDPESAERAPQAHTVTLCSQHKSSRFWIILLLVSGRAEHQTMHPSARACGRFAPPMIEGPQYLNRQSEKRRQPPPAAGFRIFGTRGTQSFGGCG
jgi:hypothetical protein